MTDEHSSLRKPPVASARRVWVYPLTALFVWGVALFLLFHFFATFQLVLLGLLATLAIASLLRPVMNRLPIRRGVAAVTVGLGFLAIFIGVIFGLSMLLLTPIRKQMENWPTIKASLNTLLAGWADRLGTSPIDVDTLASGIATFIVGEGFGTAFAKTADFSASLLIVAAFIFLGSIYILIEPPGRLIKPILLLLPPARQGPVRMAIEDLEPRLRNWLLGTLVGMVVIGVASWIGYTIIGLEFAIAIAVFAGIVEAIPTLGPAVTLVLSLLVAATQGATQVVGVLIVYAVVQGLESHVLIPLIMRRAVNIPAVVSLFTLVFWGKLLGIAGLLLAIPLDLVIWTFLDHLIIRPQEQSLTKLGP